LSDENADPLFRTELLKRDPELVIWKIGDPGVPSMGTSDPDILCWCEENSFTLVTFEDLGKERITNGNYTH
jgi:hypothetical protein